MPAAKPPPKRPRILLVRLSALGDVVFALPALKALRRALPEAQLEWLTEDRHAGLLRNHPDLDGLRLFPRRKGAWSSFRHLLGLRQSGPWDAVLDFQGNLKSGLHLCFLRSPLKVGFAAPVGREGAHRFLHQKVVVDPHTPRALRDWALVQRLSELWSFSLPDPASLLRQADPWPVESGPGLASGVGPLVLLHSSTTHYGRDKAWPDSSWQALSRGLNERGALVLWLWTPTEKTRVAELVTKGNGILAPATPELESLMGLCDEASLVIGTDSGPLHLAARRGTSVLGLFGPTNPAIYGPVGPRVRVLSSLTPEAAPPRRTRHEPSHLMAALTPELVLDTAIKLLRL